MRLADRPAGGLVHDPGLVGPPVRLGRPGLVVLAVGEHDHAAVARLHGRVRPPVAGVVVLGRQLLVPVAGLHGHRPAAAGRDADRPAVGVHPDTRRGVEVGRAHHLAGALVDHVRLVGPAVRTGRAGLVVLGVGEDDHGSVRGLDRGVRPAVAGVVALDRQLPGSRRPRRSSSRRPAPARRAARPARSCWSPRVVRILPSRAYQGRLGSPGRVSLPHQQSRFRCRACPNLHSNSVLGPFSATLCTCSRLGAGDGSRSSAPPSGEKEPSPCLAFSCGGG